MARRESLRITATHRGDTAWYAKLVIGSKQRFMLLIVLAFAVHALVLRFIYPGYYSPLWPNHGDFYIPLALANAPLGISHYLDVPRPVGEAFFWATGKLGLHGSIFAVLFLIMMNCAISTELFRRFFPIKRDFGYLAAFVTYTFLLFSHPYFYEFATHDSFSQLSFFLLTLATLFFLRYTDKRKRSAAFLSFSCTLLAFLAKETYGITALFLSTTWFVTQRDKGLQRAAMPFVISSTALALALFANIANESMFIDGGSGPDSTYHMVLAPASVLREWWRYATSGLNVLVLLVLAALALSARLLLSRRAFIAILVTMVAAALAWLPNALLPSHFYPGYSSNGIYLLFLPIMLLPLLSGAPKARGLVCSGAILIGTFASPVFSAEKYDSNSWSLLQEKINRNLVTALNSISDDLKTDANYPVLVSGLNFPFNPFNQAYAIRDFSHMQNIEFSVVTYDNSQFQRGRIKFVPPGTHPLTAYNEIWAFRPDGTLLSRVRSPERLFAAPIERVGLSRSDLVFYPELMEVFNINDARPTADEDAYTYLKCGTELISYGNFPGAEKCLSESIKSASGNPYPFFYLGVAQERQGKRCIARSSFQKAVAIDGPRPSNPAFRQALLNNGCDTDDNLMTPQPSPRQATKNEPVTKVKTRAM